jgi:putative ABC transport system permease protein
MPKVLGLALKNLMRYKRRSLLTGLLIAFGVVAVIVFVGLSDSFKRAVVGQITDSVLSHMQVHRKGYMASIDNLPLDRSLPPKAYQKLLGILENDPGIEAVSPRIKFGAMLSNYTQTTNVRLNGIDPVKEMAAVPLLKTRVKEDGGSKALLKKGEVLLPEMLAKGMQVKTGDTVVLVANNKDGSVNGMTFKVAGVVESLMGPGGRDGYIHINDAAALLRMPKPEIAEVAIKAKEFGRLAAVKQRLEKELLPIKNKKGQPMFELHGWAELTPFNNVVRMIDLMNLGIKIILIAVVLISVLNVMMMSVYERVREIGALGAMGTSPGRIRSLFVAEGFCLGLASSIAGSGDRGGGAGRYEPHRGGGGLWPQRTGLHPGSSITPTEVVFACLIVLAVSVLASLQPAAKAARLDPVEALRHV